MYLPLCSKKAKISHADQDSSHMLRRPTREVERRKYARHIQRADLHLAGPSFFFGEAENSIEERGRWFSRESAELSENIDASGS